MVGQANRCKRVMAAVLITTLAAASTLLLFPGSPLKPGLMQFFTWLQTVPPFWSAVFFTALQCCAVLLMLPATPFNLASGYMFTIWVGSVCSLISLAVSGVISFLIGRYLARGWVEEQLEKRPQFRSIDNAVADRGFYIVFLVTLAPVFPSGICHYLFGITKVGFWAYTLATCIGLVPGTVSFTYMGSLMGDLADIFQEPHGREDAATQVFWLVTAVIATIVMIFVMSMLTRQALIQAMQESEWRQPGDHPTTV
eukprot:NODE_3032_length_951_cov_122.555825_g3012_i0.p1 GENE.NODE_3032_length_951_cov_122.555825_g3012_i0~~NODE_3032_length_951_cov_122.555825_g3012_i0.p1  ORF type:complete len:281 (+),score=19.08 NODE_3032_length_951_cov_122.555825_g3012_i0:83-844(+)